MARVLTGIQSSGRQHLGNILGAIRPAIEMSKDSKNEAFLFIADLHSLTTVKDAAQRKDNLIATAAAWLACGLDPEKVVFYAQSDLPECTELTWYLNCFTPYPMLANAHSFKDKSDNLSDVNAGLFDYPVLMASDILLYDAELVPVGKDQKQHLEITRDLASSFNHRYGDTFVAPEASIAASVMTIPGTDGRKMSKSYGNVIDVFLPKKQLKKQSDGHPDGFHTHWRTRRIPETCHVYALYKLLGITRANGEELAGQVSRRKLWIRSCENRPSGSHLGRICGGTRAFRLLHGPSGGSEQGVESRRRQSPSYCPGDIESGARETGFLDGLLTPKKGLGLLRIKRG